MAVAEWTKGGKVLFKSVQYAGFVGVLTGIKPNAFGVSINERLLGGSVRILVLISNYQSHFWMLSKRF